jgi:ligand-binding sensor domain-containing protein/signal transduction histidine kinase/CheY-like chemotaxis protein
MKDSKRDITGQKRAFLTKIFIFPVLLCLALPGTGLAQRQYFKNFTIDDGLVQSYINAVCIDRYGYLWVGSFGGGADRFDGRTFDHFTGKDGLSDNSVYSIIKTRNGDLWFGTENGLSKFDYSRRSFVSYTPKEGLHHSRVWRIHEDRAGYLWLALFTHGADRFDPASGTFQHLSTRDGLIDNNVRTILEDNNGITWFGTLKGISKYNGQTFVNGPVTRRLSGHAVYAIYQDQKHNLWFGTDAGVFLFDQKTITHYNTTRGLCHNTVKVILQDSKGRYWFGTDGGVSLLEHGSFTTFNVSKGLCYDRIEDIYEDTEGNIWFATQSCVSQYKAWGFTYMNSKDGLKDDLVWAIWQDKTGALWFTSGKGITTYSPAAGPGPPTVIPPRYADKIAYPLYEDRDGHLWFGDGKHIVHYNPDTRSFTDISKKLGLGNHELFSIMQDSERRMWFGTQRDGVFIFDREKNTLRQVDKKDGLIDNTIATMCEDLLGNTWLGTNEGISVYNQKSGNITNITRENGLNQRYITTIIKDRDNHLWIGTYGGGILRYSQGPTNEPGKGEFEIFDTSQRMIDDKILSMTFDLSGKLWAGTIKGIVSLDVEEYERSGKTVITNYSRDEGFPGAECNQNAVYIDRKGYLWFGTTRGAIRIDPRKERKTQTPPVTHITGLRLFLENVDWQKTFNPVKTTGFGLPQPLALPYTRNHLTFDFIGINLTSPGGVRYRYMLEGIDKDWFPVSSATYATYSNVPPGNYVFKVKASNSSGIWNKEPAAYAFTITAPFWKRGWFHASLVFLFLGGLYLYIRLRTRKLVRQRSILEKQIQLHTKELQQEKQKVEQINRELEQRVEERTRKLAIANKQLLQAQKMEAIGALASGVAHDLNNVLAGLVSYPELLLLKISENSPLKDYIQTIKTSGEKAAAIVQDLLTMARRGVEVTETVNLNQVILDFLKSPELEKILSYHPGTHVQEHLDEQLQNILGSPVHLSKTLMNLMSNAAEAMPDGGVITVTTENRNISRPVHGYDEVAPGDYVVLRVSDTGTGISSGDIDKIFEPFYTKKKMGKSGTGLGMTVVWTTVNDHSGYITVDSDLDKGTTFTLYFPATEQKLKHQTPKTSMEELMGKGESILVVDDVEEQRNASKLMLTSLGYTVEAVNSGEAAIQYAGQNPVDLLILDMVMEPGISGVETYRRILELYPNQKAVIVSGLTETADIEEAKRLGARAYIKKPFGIEEIGRAVKNVLNPEN